MTERKPPLPVVEDSDEDFEAIERVLTMGIAEVVRAKTGDHGLALLRASDLRSRAVVVLLDLNTPGSEGREVLREIKADEALRVIPVIVFATSANPNDIAACYRGGANSYHLKPLELHAFESRVTAIAKYWIDHVVLMEKD